MEIKEYISNELSSGEIIAVIGSVNNDSLMTTKNNDGIKVLEYLTAFADNEKIIKAIKVVDANKSLLNKLMNDLTIADSNRLAIMEAFLKKEKTHVFLDIHKGLKYREQQNLKRLLKALADNNRNIILVSNDVEFYFNLVKKVIIVDNNTILKIKYPVDWFDEELYNFVAKPPIIDFIMNCKKRNIKIDNCVETKELLKSIYRSVDK